MFVNIVNQFKYYRLQNIPIANPAQSIGAKHDVYKTK